MNATVNEDVVEGSPDGNSVKNEQAQPFYIDNAVYLLGFSISVIGKTGGNFDMEIRNESYNGDPIYAFAPLFPTTNEWLNITFIEEIVLTPGTYFLWMQAVGAQYSTWEQGSDNNTDTWVFTDPSWEVTSYGLTLKVNTSELINPEDVNMEINEVPVINTNTGQGSVNMTNDINSHITELTVSSDESIIFFYSLESVFYRNCSIQYDTQIQSDGINWNLTLDSGYLEDPYFNYKINVSGIKDEYYETINVYNQTDGIGYTSISSGVIGIDTEATNIIFESQNYIESVALNSNLHFGTIATINVSAKGIGDIYAFIWDDETLLNQSLSYNVSNQISQWYLEPLLDLNSVTIEIFFNGSNEIGYYSEVFNISKVSEIISTPIHGNTLDNFTFTCQYWDFYSQLPISDGIVTFNFGDFSGVMKMDQNGNYSYTLDLYKFGLLPGNYSISVTAEKENYGTVYSEIPIVIDPRSITMELTKSRKSIAPGNTIEFELNLKDNENQKSYLLRPVDIEIRIYNSGNHLNGDLVFIETLNGTYSKETFSWDVPSSIEEGSYDIVIEVNSDYYSGILNLDGAIEVKSSTFWIISLPILIGLVSSLVSGYFIKKERVKKSLLGLMILHDNGAPLAEKISYTMQKSDSALVSGAFIGILSLIKEITGSRLRTIEIQGGYVNLIHGNSFWLIVFIKDNPKWIEKGILNLKDEIQ
ncbi:MAG: hypothetical protein ACTSWK_02580, partial [Promethearchaeota archaeon]